MKDMKGRAELVETKPSIADCQDISFVFVSSSSLCFLRLCALSLFSIPESLTEDKRAQSSTLKPEETGKIGAVQVKPS